MELEYKYEWNLTYRIDHWLRVLVLAVLTLTGFYIHWPFWAGWEGGIDLMAWMRFAHFVAAYLFILGLVVRLYLAFNSTFDADWRDFGIWRILRNVSDDLLYYFFIKETHKEYRRYNPLQALIYLFWALLILFSTLTGFALYHGRVFGFLPAPESFQWVLYLLGGESYTRIWHFLSMWAFLVTAAGHIYMASIATWAGRDHTLRSIITGYKLKPLKAGGETKHG